jgi:GxxExxY protein
MLALMYPHRDLTEEIIAAAIEVHRQLSSAYRESVYQVSLAHEFHLRQIPFEREKAIAVIYKGIVAGTHKLDFLVDDKVVLELKVVETILDVCGKKIICYLTSI